MDLLVLIDNFKEQSLHENVLSALSGGHTLGFTLSSTFRNHIYNDTNNIDTTLVSKKGLLHSDQALFNGGVTDELVRTYSKNLETLSKDFAESIVKMGNMKPLNGNQG